MSDDDNGCTEAQCQCGDRTTDVDTEIGVDVTETLEEIHVLWDLAEFAEACSRIVEEAEQYSKVVENYESDLIVSARGCPECRGQMSVRISATTGEPVEVVHHCRHCGTEIPVDPDEL